MKKIFVYLKRLIKSIVDNDFFGMASEMGFMCVLGIFPTLLFLTGIFGWAGKHDFIKPILSFLVQIMPDESVELVFTVLKEAVFYSKGGFWAIFGFLITVFLTTNMLAIIAKGLNRAYKIGETRSFLYTRILAFFMSVPKTTVHEYCSLIFRENDIRRTRQSLYILPIPQTAREEIFPDCYFGFRLFSRYMGHYLRTFLFADRIRHFDYAIFSNCMIRALILLNTLVNFAFASLVNNEVCASASLIGLNSFASCTTVVVVPELSTFLARLDIEA